MSAPSQHALDAARIAAQWSRHYGTTDAEDVYRLAEKLQLNFNLALAEAVAAALNPTVAKTRECPVCGGKGEVEVPQRPGWELNAVRCEVCTCGHCGGTGKLKAL